MTSPTRARAALRTTILTTTILLAVFAAASAAPPKYSITQIAPLGADSVGSANAISPNCKYIAGVTWHNGGSNALIYNLAGASGTALPVATTASPARPYDWGLSVNDNGTVVGYGVATSSNSWPIPLIWTNGSVSVLPLPTGYVAGKAFSVNAANTVVGEVLDTSGNGYATIFTGSGATLITTPTSAGGQLVSANGIANTGDIVGMAIDPTNARTYVPFYLHSGSSIATVIAVSDSSQFNGGNALAVSPNGRYIVGAEDYDSTSNYPFIFDTLTGITKEVPLPTGATEAELTSVNDLGRAVGVGSGKYAVPFYYDGTSSFTLEEMVNDPTWNIEQNTSSSAFAISDNGIIAGRAFHGDVLAAFEATPVPEPSSFALLLCFAAAPLLWLLRRRR